MKGRIEIDGTDYTADLLRSGAQTLTVESEDDEGNQTMGDLEVELFDEENELSNALDSPDALPVSFGIAGTTMFEGDTEPEETVVDWDRETVSIKALPRLRAVLDALADTKIRESRLVPYEMWVYESPQADWLYPYAASFFAVDEIFAACITPVCPYSIEIPGVTLSHYYLGGQRAISPFLLPDWTALELLKAFAQLFDCLLYMNGGVLTLAPKKTLLYSTESPLLLDLIRDSFKMSPVSAGTDSLAFSFSNANESIIESIGVLGTFDTQWYGGYRRNRLASPGVIVKPRKIESIFRYASEPGQGEQDRVNIPGSDTVSDYIVTNSTSRASLPGLTPCMRVTARDIVRTWYDCELHGIPGWEADFSLQGREDVLPELIKPYRRIRHPKGSGYRYFIRSAEIDRVKETVRIKAVGYDL